MPVKMYEKRGKNEMHFSGVYSLIYGMCLKTYKKLENRLYIFYKYTPVYPVSRNSLVMEHIS